MKPSYFLILTSSVLTLFFLSCNDKKTVFKPTKADIALHQKAKAYISPLPVFDITTKSKSERLKIALGEKLFLDSILSFNRTQNCNTCHQLDNFGVDNKRVSQGDNGRSGTRNTPTVFNATLQFAQFWDAHVKTVEEQVSGPLFGTDEMGMPDTISLIKRLQEEGLYKSLFDEAFPDIDSSICIETIAESLGSFQKTLLTSGDRFDQYLKGDLGVLTTQEKNGLNTFIDRGCLPCHSGSLVGGNMSQKFAVYGYYWDYTGSTFFDKGKYKHTKEAADKFFFKVPTLRNVEKTFPYFHDGSVESLTDAIQIMAQAELNTTLTTEEVKDIEAFLKTLTGSLPK